MQWGGSLLSSIHQLAPFFQNEFQWPCAFANSSIVNRLSSSLIGQVEIRKSVVHLFQRFGARIDARQVHRSHAHIGLFLHAGLFN